MAILNGNEKKMPTWFGNILLGVVGVMVSAFAWWTSTTLLAHDRTLARLEFQVGQIWEQVVPLDKRAPPRY